MKNRVISAVVLLPLLFVLVLFGLEVILSFWTMRRQKNQSLVEEMRAME